jgi:hypothetical protein
VDDLSDDSARQEDLCVIVRLGRATDVDLRAGLSSKPRQLVRPRNLVVGEYGYRAASGEIAVAQMTWRVPASDHAIDLHVAIRTAAMRAADADPSISASSSRYLFWSAAQLITHHACGGRELQPGDLVGTGTISGPGDDQAAACSNGPTTAVTRSSCRTEIHAPSSLTATKSSSPALPAAGVRIPSASEHAARPSNRHIRHSDPPMSQSMPGHDAPDGTHVTTVLVPEPTRPGPSTYVSVSV